jgi:hypothetical protein
MRFLRAVLLFAFLSGCDSGEDSWAHYQRERLYNGGSPSISSDDSGVLWDSELDCQFLPMRRDA